jgi:hypothetical protein
MNEKQMNLTLISPRSRPEHLASITSPEGCEAAFLILKGRDEDVVAERDPSAPLYHAVLPALEAGQPMSFEVETTNDAPASAGISFDLSEDRINISLGGSDLMTFHCGPDNPKPVINPILTPGGTNMLREPMTAWSEGEHPWQRGLTLMHGAINGVDCWNEQDRETFGRTEQDKMTVSHGPVSLVIASENSWYRGDKKLMTDHRSYRIFDTDRKAVVLDIALTLKASEGPLTFGATKEAGFLCIRVNPTMNANNRGTMRNVYGAADEVGCWSLPSHWMDYCGPVGNEVAGFAIFDHPQNLRYPTTWHVRGYGLFAPNCWMFKPDHHLKEGEELTFRWRVIIHSGDTEVAGIAVKFLDYVDGVRTQL